MESVTCCECHAPYAPAAIAPFRRKLFFPSAQPKLTIVVPEPRTDTRTDLDRFWLT